MGSLYICPNLSKRTCPECGVLQLAQGVPSVCSVGYYMTGKYRVARYVCSHCMGAYLTDYYLDMISGSMAQPVAVEARHYELPRWVKPMLALARGPVRYHAHMLTGTPVIHRDGRVGILIGWSTQTNGLDVAIQGEDDGVSIPYFANWSLADTYLHIYLASLMTDQLTNPTNTGV